MKYSIEDFHITSTDMDLELFTDNSYRDRITQCINEVMSQYESDNHKVFSEPGKMFIRCYESMIIISDSTAANRLIGFLSE